MAGTDNEGAQLKLLTRDFLDERLVPELEYGTVQYFDHVRRYLLAQQYVGGRRVLEIACGTGYGGEILRQGSAQQVIGIDLSLDALRYTMSQWPYSQVIQGDAGCLPLPSASLDAIVSFETLEHLSEPGTFLSEAKRLLRTDGLLILSTPNRAVASPDSDTPFSPYHAFEPTLDELRDLLTDSDFTILAMHGLTHSARAQALIRSASAPFQRQPNQIAWVAYLRMWIRAVLPPLIIDWLGRRRQIPVLDISDSVLTQDASTESAYFVAVCQLA